MKVPFIITILLFSFIYLSGQTEADTIQILNNKVLVFQKKGYVLSNKQLRDVTRTNADASKEMRIARANLHISNFFLYAGGYMTGWPLGQAIDGTKPNWGLIALGMGTAAVSIPFTIGYKKHAVNAARIYNNGLKNPALRSLNFKIGAVRNGMGFNLTF
jgi:hypothetical protein